MAAGTESAGGDDDAALTSCFASMSLKHEARNPGEETTSTGRLPLTCRESQTELFTSDAEVQCRPITADKHTAMTDYSAVILMYH